MSFTRQRINIQQTQELARHQYSENSPTSSARLQLYIPLVFV